jgi:hypothetical protein
MCPVSLANHSSATQASDMTPPRFYKRHARKAISERTTLMSLSAKILPAVDVGVGKAADTDIIAKPYHRTFVIVIAYAEIDSTPCFILRPCDNR